MLTLGFTRDAKLMSRVKVHCLFDPSTAPTTCRWSFSLFILRHLTMFSLWRLCLKFHENRLKWTALNETTKQKMRFWKWLTLACHSYVTSELWLASRKNDQYMFSTYPGAYLYITIYLVSFLLCNFATSWKIRLFSSVPGTKFLSICPLYRHVSDELKCNCVTSGC